MNRPYDSILSDVPMGERDCAFLELTDEEHFEVYRHAKIFRL